MEGSRLAVRMICALAFAGLLPAAAARGALTRVGPGIARAAEAVGGGAARPLPAGIRLRVTITLKPRDPAALAAYARAVSTPGSADYRRYLTPSGFGRRFGAAAAQINAVRSSLRARGLRPGAVSPGRLSIPVSATAGQLERAFSVSLERVARRGRAAVIAADGRPALAAGAAAVVQSVLGLNTSAAPHPLLLRARRNASIRALAVGHAATAGPAPCAAARAAAPGQSAYTADQIASAYGFSGLYQAGDNGAGITVAVYELEPDDPSDIAAYQSCYGTHATVTYVPVDGGAGSGGGSGEAALDIENLIGLAPNANVLVYRGPNSNSGDPGSGPYDTFSQIINQDRARVVTVSWGQCESALGQPDAVAENTLFQQAAVQGQSIVAASGDSGAQDCDTGGGITQTQAAVDDPSSQPFVTGVGGTSLTALGPRPTESAWNSGGNLINDMVQPGAGGGGVSNLWPMPPAQRDAPASLGVTTPLAAGSACGNASGYCRLVPDVSADADPSTGYLVYWNGSGSVSQEPTGWQGIGGTSGAAPLWAALLTLADASRACSTSPVGYADPALYRAAATGYATDFNDVTTGNNDFTQTNGGRYAATTGYDPVTGLGTPNAVALAAALCTDTVRLPALDEQRSTIHASVSVRLRASDTAGAPLAYTASGLPPGLKLNTMTGRVNGRPSRIGHYAVRIAAHDNEASTASVSFIWTVGAEPTVSRLSLIRTGAGPQLTFTVTAGRGAPALQTLTITVPRYLRLASRRGVTVTYTTAKHVRIRFTDHAAGGTALMITLRQPTDSMRVRLAPPSLRAAGGQEQAAALQSGSRVPLTLSVTDANSGHSKLTPKVTIGT
jgi:subtilase family serine protease